MFKSLKLKLCAGLLALVGLVGGVAISQVKPIETRAAEATVYTLDGTITGGTSAYADTSNIEQGGISWGVDGNTTMNPWRIGGKGLAGVDRLVVSKSAPAGDYNLTKVSVTTGTKTLSSINSITIQVGSGSSAETRNDKGSKSFTEDLVSNTLEFTRPSNENWSNAYITVIFNVTTANSNQYIQLLGITLYADNGSSSSEESAGSSSESSSQSSESSSTSLTVVPLPSSVEFVVDNDAKSWAVTVTSHGLDYSGVKLGTTSLEGSFTVHLDVGTWSFYAASWKGAVIDDTTITFSAADEGEISPANISLSPNTGIAGNGPYVIDNADDPIAYRLTVTKADTFTFVADKRCVIWYDHIQTFIDNNMKFDTIPTTNTGHTADCSANWDAASDEFKKLKTANEDFATIFCSAAPYADAYHRLVAWARANGKDIVNNEIVVYTARTIFTGPNSQIFTPALIWVLSTGGIGLVTLALLAIVHRKRYN